MKRLLSILTLILFYSCSHAQHEYKITSQDFQTKINTQHNNIQLIDVRTPSEFNKGHITNATNIDFFDKNFKQKLSKLNNQKAIYIYCASGNRSGKTTRILKELGFNKIYDLDGGIKKWKKEGYPIQ